MSAPNSLSAITQQLGSSRLSRAWSWAFATALFLVIWVVVQTVITYALPPPREVHAVMWRWAWGVVRMHFLYSSFASVAFGGALATRWRYAGVVMALIFLVVRAVWAYVAYQWAGIHYPEIHAPVWSVYIQTNWLRLLDWSLPALLATLLIGAIQTYSRLGKDVSNR